MGWAEHVARMGKGEVHTDLPWKDPMVTHQGADQKDNIKKYPENVGWVEIALIVLDQDWDSRRAIVNAVMNLQLWGDFLTS